MQTNFAPELLANPDFAESEKVVRTCVHCGFCTATCPTYVLLGDELDSPRGRIYLMKEMLENNRPADAETVKHIDRCLSCLSCMTTCPSGVNYMHLADHARHHIEQTYRRPWIDRQMRLMLAKVLPYPRPVCCLPFPLGPAFGWVPPLAALTHSQLPLQFASTATGSPGRCAGVESRTDVCCDPHRREEVPRHPECSAQGGKAGS